MQFIDLAAQQSTIRHSLERRIKAVLDHGNYIMGPEVRELEEQLAAFSGPGHCIACPSGTDALLMALMAWNIGPGDAVFVPAYTFFATAEVVALLGATPVMVDIDPVTYTMNPGDLEKAIAAVAARDASLYPLPLPALVNKLTPRAVVAGNTSIRPQYCVRILNGKRDTTAAALKERGIPTNIYYPRPLTLLDAFRPLGYKADDMPESLKASREALALPFHPYMAEADADRVAAGIKEGL